MSKTRLKKSRAKTGSHPQAGTSATFASNLKQWRLRAFQFIVGLSVLWVVKLLAMVVASELIFKFTAASAVTLDSVNGTMLTAEQITVALYVLFFLAWIRTADDKFERLKIFCLLLVFLGIDLAVLEDSVGFVNRWKSEPLGEQVVYAYQFPEMKPPGKSHSGWHTCAYMVFEHHQNWVVYPFPHPDQVSQGNVCIDVREGLLGLQWTEHVRSCKPAAAGNQRAESSDLQTICKPSNAGLTSALHEIWRHKSRD